jgi:hypothetical protein
MREIMRGALLLGLHLVVGCTDTDSATNLNAAGPPMLAQVRMIERTVDPDDPSMIDSRRVFAFGTHDLAISEEISPNPLVVAVGNSMRLIIDELLVGNNLEEIACRGRVDDDAFQRVPRGATPDSIAACAVSDGVLDASCRGATAVCLCDNDAGCNRGDTIVERGRPVGVLDDNQDGASDDTQFIDGAVGITCGDITVPIDLDASYWNPSGDQNKPAMGGFDALGPAIVLTSQGPFPTNLDCNLVFADDVVDKQGNRVCAPPNGDVSADCTPGDTSAFQFRTEPLKFQPALFADGAVGVSRTADAIFSTTTTLQLDTLNAATVTVTEAGAAFTAFTLDTSVTQRVTINWDAMLAPETVYTITFSTGVTDTYGRSAPETVTITFTTGA